MEQTHPTFGNGKICYLEIPAVDINISATFYQKVFGWHLRNDGDGNISFDDSVSEVSGMWVTGRKPSNETGIMISIMVRNISATLDLVIQNGGKATEADRSSPGKTALFHDPAGNVFCLYQSRHAK